MTISAISGNSNTQAWQATMQQRKQDFSQLGTALQGGDLAGAQQAFSALQSLNPGAQGQSSTAPANGKSGNAVSADVAALGQALQSGNIADAQSAFAKIKSDMKAQKGGHHHRHGGAKSSGIASTNATTSTTTPTAAAENGKIDYSA